MDASSSTTLLRLIRMERLAALGTLRDGAPFVSLVPFAVADDLLAFWFHLSRLAVHTKDIEADPRVSMMVAEHDDPFRNPLSLARVSIQGSMALVGREEREYEAGKVLYLTRFPEAEGVFSLGDFNLYRLAPSAARYVAGFGKTYALTLHDFSRVAGA